MSGWQLHSLQLRTSLTTRVLLQGGRGSQFLWDPRRSVSFRNTWIPITMSLETELIWTLLSALCNHPVLLPNCPHSPSQQPPLRPVVTSNMSDSKGALVPKNDLHLLMSSLEIFKEIPDTIHIYFKLCSEDRVPFISCPLNFSLYSTILFSLPNHLRHASTETWNTLALHFHTQFLPPSLCWVGYLQLTSLS